MCAMLEKTGKAPAVFLARDAGKQRGFLLIAAVVLVVVAALVLTVIVFLSTTGSISSARHLSSNQALFIAESGIEKGIREWKLNPAYAGETGTSFANGNFTVTTSLYDYFGNQLPTGRKRFVSVGTVGGAAARTVNAIAGPENLLPPAANADFNQAKRNPCVPDPDPLVDCEPEHWDLNALLPPSRDIPANQFLPWDDIDPAPGSSTDRAAYVAKRWNGPLSATGAGNFTFSPAVVVIAPVTLDLRFDYWIEGGNAAKEGYFNFTLSDGITNWSSPETDSPHTGEWRTMLTTVTITGTGTKLITNLSFTFELKSGQPKEGWLDNILLGSGGGTPKLEVKTWREDYQ
jgi:Tfp pilus assembly protein PilX